MRYEESKGERRRRASAIARPFTLALPRLWFMPIIGAVVAVAISAGTLALDRALTASDVTLPIVAASPPQIGTLYSVIAASILNLLALVFTILIVVLQLTSSQYSHRALRTLLQDRQSRVTLGIFVATFLHALLVLAALGTAAQEDRVAGVSVASTLLLSLISVAAFLLFIDHIAQSIRVTSIINAIGNETRGLVDRVYRDSLDAGGETEISTPDGRPEVVTAPEAGIVTTIDKSGLVEACQRFDAVAQLVPAVGDFVPRGAPLLRIYTADGRASHPDGSGPDDLAQFVDLGTERTMDDDVAFGFRQLVDVAARALSPGTNDPTIAVHAIDQIHDLLRSMSTRHLREGVYRDEQETVRFVLLRPTWEDLVALAADEIRHYGANSVQVVRRLRAMLEDLLSVAWPDRQEPLRRQVALLDESIERHYPESKERVIAKQPDLQGHGSPRIGPPGAPRK